MLDYTSILKYLPITTATTADYILINSAGNNKKILLGDFLNAFGLVGCCITLTTTGTSGAATKVGSTLNIPQYQGQLTLTTTGTSGAATLIGNTLNIPQYSGGSTTAWDLSGNAAPAGSFIGTTNSTPLQFKRVGNQAGLLGDGMTNAFYGVQAGQANVSGQGNTAIGDRSMKNATAADNNTAVGVDSLLTLTTGYQNVAIGYHNQLGTTTGHDNTSVGQDTMYSNTTGNYNTAIGRAALQSNTTGSSNTAIGYSALFATNSLLGGNVALGYHAGSLGNHSNRLFIDNQPRGSAANELTNSLIVGTFDAVPANQNVTLNSTVNLPYLTSSALSNVVSYDTTSGQLFYRSTSNWDTAYTNIITSLTTTGTSGASTLSSNTLNIPQYQGQLTLTTTGTSGAATLIGNTLNIPQYSGGGGGITTLNTLTASTQTFATATTGSDFSISSTTSTHTFSIPDAGASARGLVTTGTQTFAGIKTFSSAPKVSGQLTGYLLYYAGDGTLTPSNVYYLGTNSGIVLGGTSSSSKLGVIASVLNTQQQKAIHVTATTATTTTYIPRAIHIEFTTAGSQTNTAYPIRGVETSLLAGYTGSVTSVSSYNSNAVAGTASSIVTGTNTYGNQGSYNIVSVTTTGSNQGVIGYSKGGNISVGGIFRAGDTTAAGNKNAAKYVGVIGIARNDTAANSVSLAGYFGLNTSDPTFANAALIADNADAAYDIFVARDNGTAKWSIIDGGNTQWADSVNMQFNTTTGTKIGTATNQKISFWNATPIIQPATGGAAATLVSGGGTALTSTDTFDGYTLQQVVKALRNIGLLA